MCPCAVACLYIHCRDACAALTYLHVQLLIEIYIHLKGHWLAPAKLYEGGWQLLPIIFVFACLTYTARQVFFFLAIVLYVVYNHILNFGLVLCLIWNGPRV